MPKWLTALLTLSVDRFLLLASIFLIILSFDPICYRNGAWDFCLKAHPNLYIFVPGCFLLILFLWRQRWQQPQHAYPEKIKGGYKLQFDSDHSISVVIGAIEDFSGGEHSAIVLPANTSFDDECIHDKRSALGSFFLRHFPSGIDDIQKMLRSAAVKTCGQSESSFTAAPQGTTVLLEKPLGSPFMIMVTAVTSIDPELGISADTLSLLSAVKQVFKLASQKRISSLTMPVMGTGHGGLDFKAALSLILVQCANSMQSEGWHHVREVKIVVFDPENRKKEIVKKLVGSVGSLTQI